ncbi:MAG: formylglycine-generating enzyme family protein [Armatimonadetes bacterium]|nr:formylglycine-generating enzyme family protein [Armatimonadota bacterium]
MGSPDGQGEADEHPQRRVYLSAFWMDKHEVTVGQYKRFCQAAGKSMATGNSDDAHPVVYVSWEDADAYAKWAEVALPTEAQWEKAARGGLEGMAYPWGNDFEAAKANNGNRRKPAGSYAPNGYGLFDMAANVLEWCEDWHDAGWYQRMPSRDPVNTIQRDTHVYLCRSFQAVFTYLRSASRYIHVPGHRGGISGLRCAEGARSGP